MFFYFIRFLGFLAFLHFLSHRNSLNKQEHLSNIQISIVMCARLLEYLNVSVSIGFASGRVCRTWFRVRWMIAALLFSDVCYYRTIVPVSFPFFSSSLFYNFCICVFENVASSLLFVPCFLSLLPLSERLR